MKTAYGVTPTGFVRKPRSVILAEIEQDQLAGIASDWDVSPESPVGQMNASVADKLDEIWALGETIYYSMDPDKTRDALLIALAKLTGTQKRASSYSVVELTFELDQGVTLESGTHFVQDQDNASSRWTPLGDFTAELGGSQNSLFRAENTGPIAASAGKLTVIATPVVGWASPNNVHPATPGHPIDDDATLEQRRKEQLANAAGATIPGIRAALERVDGIVSVLALENDTAVVDANGLPPNSFEMVVWDGSEDGSRVSNATIAQAIWSKKGSAARSSGVLSATVVDVSGAYQTVYFSRSQALAVYVALDLEVADGFDVVAFANAFVAAANASITGGSPVRWAKLMEIAMEQSKVVDVNSIHLGLSPSPAGGANIPVSLRQIARFDSGRVTVST